MKNSKPTIYDPSFLPNNIYSGVPSWLNLPVLEDAGELKGFDAVVSGVPWEGGCTIGGYSSCTEGPKAIRSVSIRYQTSSHDACWATLYYLNGAAQRKRDG